MDYSKYNERVFECMSTYLNLAPTFINERLYKNTGGDELAFSALLAAVCMLDTVNSPDDKLLYMKYFIPMVHKLDTAEFEADLYYKTLKFNNITLNKWTLTELVCKPYEAFVCGDPEKLPDGRILPRIGYFEKEFKYPAVLEDGREWMTLLPNETITIKPHIEKSHGKVLTFGLGLGYFHKPEELKAEIEDAGFLDVDVRGVIGPCWLIRNLDRAWKNKTKRENIMRVVRLLEKEDSLMGLSTHFLSISRKQKDDGQKISD